jgi:hypothetical protein
VNALDVRATLVDFFGAAMRTVAELALAPPIIVLITLEGSQGLSISKCHGPSHFLCINLLYAGSIIWMPSVINFPNST